MLPLTLRTCTHQPSSQIGSPSLVILSTVETEGDSGVMRGMNMRDCAFLFPITQVDPVEERTKAVVRARFEWHEDRQTGDRQRRPIVAYRVYCRVGFVYVVCTVVKRSKRGRRTIIRCARFVFLARAGGCHRAHHGPHLSGRRYPQSPLPRPRRG